MLKHKQIHKKICEKLNVRVAYWTGWTHPKNYSYFTSQDLDFAIENIPAWRYLKTINLIDFKWTLTKEMEDSIKQLYLSSRRDGQWCEWAFHSNYSNELF